MVGAAAHQRRALWPTDPWYDPTRDPVAHMLEANRGDAEVTEGDQLTLEVRRDCDLDYLSRATAFIRRTVGQGTPFVVYFNHSLLHLPVIPRQAFKGRSAQGDWADALLELDADFGALLDLLDELGVAENTLVVSAGDNGPEDVLLWRGTPGYWEGSYFAGGRATCAPLPGALARPHPPRQSERRDHARGRLVHHHPPRGRAGGTDRPGDRRRRPARLAHRSGRALGTGGLPVLDGPQLYGVKWRNFKLVLVAQRYMQEPAVKLPTPQLINLTTDPQEREPVSLPHLHSWVAFHFNRLIGQFEASLHREPLIPTGASLDHVPAPPPT